MEENADNIFHRQTQAIAKTKIKVGKPPTRLQKHAPASLQLDQVNRNGTRANPFALPREPSSLSAIAIPLLSPLVLSPPPLPKEVEEFRFPVLKCDIDNGCSDNRGAYAEADGWQHPAVASGYVEPGSFFSTFQSKCVLINHSQ